ncbi:MAG TPA: hypothetical protein VM802_09660 [Chitinophaga sp.]|uniref:hypothetical protein n=1 Tax=Chitinophaga sp. TaxID=1869181 RepID=UPI002BD8B079|nr:hypothetical protein [Chitinophaga sp.]HVI45128.1 hypothetical protein [Chitinophaga sp.]
MRNYVGTVLSRRELKSINGGTMKRIGCRQDAGMCLSDSPSANYYCNAYCNDLCNWNNCGAGLGSCVAEYCICGCTRR